MAGWSTADHGPLTDCCLHDLIEHQASETPHALAVISDDRGLTYGQLSRWSNQLAHYLHKTGVGPEARVGICMERSADMMIAILGILKAGAAFVPLDPRYPQHRLAYILKDAGVSVVIADDRSKVTLEVEGLNVVCLKSDWPMIDEENSGDCSSEALPDNLAYVLYTSGSTGTPKGVMISHRAAMNYLSWCCERYRVPKGSEFRCTHQLLLI